MRRALGSASAFLLSTSLLAAGRAAAGAPAAEPPPPAAAASPPAAAIPPAAASPPSTPAPPPAAPRSSTWIDEGHAALTEWFLWSVERLDQFFADEREVDLPRARSFVRWRSDVRVRDDRRFDASTSARAELQLPSLDRRLRALRLTISGGSSDGFDPLQQGRVRAPDAVTSPSAGLRLELLDALLTQTDLHAGLLAAWPVGWFTRLRLRHAQPVADLLVARLALAGFWQTPTGWGTRQDVELERQLPARLVLRLGSTGTVTQRSRGYEWGSELSLLAAVGARSALFLGGGPYGATAAGPVVETWRVHARARRDVWRRWLFLELEPGVDWTRLPGGHRQRLRYVILRLEVQFDATAPAGGPAFAGGG